MTHHHRPAHVHHHDHHDQHGPHHGRQRPDRQRLDRQRPDRQRADRAGRLLTGVTSLATMLPAVALLCLITGWRVTGTTATRIRTRAHRGGPDRGATALEWAALAVGAVLIAGAVLAAMNQAGEEIAGNVCTNADPSTC